MRRRSASTIALCLLGAVAVSAAAQAALTKGDADSLEKKLAAILQRGAAIGRAAEKPLRTTITDREFNAYFKFQGAVNLPVGVVNPRIEILDGGRLVGYARVDLDTVRKSKERTWTDPLAYMSGTVEIRMVGVARAANGKGKIDLESATLGGLPVPIMLVQELIAYYSKTPETPTGFLLDQPFDLPQKVRQVDFTRGSAVIVQ
jgi:hypothetical protein